MEKEPTTPAQPHKKVRILDSVTSVSKNSDGDTPKHASSIYTERGKLKVSTRQFLAIRIASLACISACFCLIVFMWQDHVFHHVSKVKSLFKSDSPNVYIVIRTNSVTKFNVVYQHDTWLNDELDQKAFRVTYLADYDVNRLLGHDNQREDYYINTIYWTMNMLEEFPYQEVCDPVQYEVCITTTHNILVYAMRTLNRRTLPNWILFINDGTYLNHRGLFEILRHLNYSEPVVFGEQYMEHGKYAPRLAGGILVSKETFVPFFRYLRNQFLDMDKMHLFTHDLCVITKCNENFLLDNIMNHAGFGITPHPGFNTDYLSEMITYDCTAISTKHKDSTVLYQVDRHTSHKCFTKIHERVLNF